MRVFCTQHKIGFFTRRRNPIRCENRGHVLGEFNFHGDAKVPFETLWQYCCNCEHFCPIELDQGGLEACPACSRRISQRYMCDRCFTVSLESTTATQVKNFRLTAEGVPQPSCPGCLQASSGDLREHDCEKLGAGFKTGLNSCPICLEHLDVGPLFPSSVAQYLRKTKTANKLNVALDYTRGLFLPVENGEFVLVNGTENSRPFVLPRSSRVASKKDFYELYQDYYHCTNVNSCELHIIEPAFVERIAEGWKLQSMGVLEIADAQPEVDALTDNVSNATEFQLRERSALFSPSLIEESPAAIEEGHATTIEESSGVTCTYCGSPVETRYAFCWSCGHSTKPEAAPSKQARETIAVSNRIIADDDEPTIHLDVGRLQPAMFSWALSEPTETSRPSSRLKLTATVVIGLLLVMLGGFWLRGLLSRFGNNADAQQVTSNLHTVAGVVPKIEPTTANAETKTASNPASNQAEEELRKLRERRTAASSSDRLTILQLFANTEKRYPDDYRFPYERAKLAINGIETRSHDEAFNALSLAAGTAIKADKADEMLKGLETDRMGDFHKLSHGHREWMQIIEALKRKDATLLASN